VASRVDFTVATALQVRDEVRRELREQLPSPSEARAIAIQTGAHTLDRNGIYQPPCTKGEENEARERGRTLYPLVEVLEWNGCSPKQAAEWIDREWLNEDQDVSDCARRAADWLTRFAQEVEER
jgi:hypothetical protein